MASGVAARSLFAVEDYRHAFQLGAEFLELHRASPRILLIAASRGAADDFLRRNAGAGRLGIHALTLTQLAAQAAAHRLGQFNLAPVGPLGLEAVAARAVFQLRAQDRLGYFTPVGDTPGFTRAAARTLAELRMAGIEPGGLRGGGAPCDALADLLATFNEELLEAELADLATLYGLASTSRDSILSLPTLILDVPLRSRRAEEFAKVLVWSSAQVRIVCLEADHESLPAWERIAATPIERPQSPGSTTAAHLRRFLFAPSLDRAPAADDTVAFFSAPNELMECMEVARRAQEIAREGVPFDHVAILLRQPDLYQPLLEEAFRRAGIAAYFQHGAARPNEAGRAFLALLRCAAERFSAARFAEYCSLAQVPELDQQGRPIRKSADQVGPQDEIAATLLRVDPAPREEEPVETLAAPWRWEELIVDAAVIGGVERWERRLAGLEKELKERAKAAPEENIRAALNRDAQQLRMLAAFAVPLIRMLAALPAEANWGGWLTSLRALAETALRHPHTVLAVLEELQPMADVGPATLDEIYCVLEDRLRFLRAEPPKRRYGHVFVAPLEEARCRWFDYVFIPGVAEGMFPKRASEDPLLLDAYRQKVDRQLTQQDQRVARERLLLRGGVAAGAKLVISYPRVDNAQSRPRVPSFYVLELVRAAEGALPDLQKFQDRAAGNCPVRQGWPAPTDPVAAVDDAEYDIAIIERTRQAPPNERPGMGRYLMEANASLSRSMRARYRRWASTWKPEDGMVAADEPTKAILASQRLNARPYSATALERFAACPYRFYLHAIAGLAPRQEIAELEQMDPRTRGTIFHDLLHELIAALREKQLLPLTRANREWAMLIADDVVQAAAKKWEAELAPAIPRVWESEIDDLRLDLRGWVRHASGEGADWEPVESEVAFEPTDLLDRVKLRGRADLLERRIADGVYRVTDLKTGRKPEKPPIFLGRGRILQPSLYGMTLEILCGGKVESGRLFYCTHRGGFEESSIKLIGPTREFVAEALRVIDSSIERGFLPAAPDEKACSMCEYRSVCGPYEEIRVARKDQRALNQLQWLRSIE